MVLDDMTLHVAFSEAGKPCMPCPDIRTCSGRSHWSLGSSRWRTERWMACLRRKARSYASRSESRPSACSSRDDTARIAWRVSEAVHGNLRCPQPGGGTCSPPRSRRILARFSRHAFPPSPPLILPPAVTPCSAVTDLLDRIALFDGDVVVAEANLAVPCCVGKGPRDRPHHAHQRRRRLDQLGQREALLNVIGERGQGGVFVSQLLVTVCPCAVCACATLAARCARLLDTHEDGRWLERHRWRIAPGEVREVGCSTMFVVVFVVVVATAAATAMAPFPPLRRRSHHPHPHTLLGVVLDRVCCVCVCAGRVPEWAPANQAVPLVCGHCDCDWLRPRQGKEGDGLPARPPGAIPPASGLTTLIALFRCIDLLTLLL